MSTLSDNAAAAQARYDQFGAELADRFLDCPPALEALADDVRDYMRSGMDLALVRKWPDAKLAAFMTLGTLKAAELMASIGMRVGT